LQLDSASECDTTQWWLAVAAAAFTIVTYVFGFPILLFFGMRRLRCYQKVRMPRHVADRHVDLVQQGVWIPCSENDVVAVQLHGSFHALKLEDLHPPRFSWHGVLKMLLAKKGPPRREEATMPSQVPEGGILVEAETEEKAGGFEGGGMPSQVPEGGILVEAGTEEKAEGLEEEGCRHKSRGGILVEAGTEEKAEGLEGRGMPSPVPRGHLGGGRDRGRRRRGLEGGGMPSQVPEGGILVEAETEEKAGGFEGGGRITKETLTRLARRWRVKAHMQAAPPVDLYLPRDAFVECGGVDEASCAAALEALEARSPAFMWKRSAPVALADCAGDEEGDEEGSKEGSVIMTRDGRLIKGVHLYEKEDVGDKGAITVVPVTMLDDPMFNKALDQFRDAFEDAYYYWQVRGHVW
ncbi:hypothetical protein CYMTET_20949, partial [Cymbomonas tetramitiformis]